MTIFDNGHDLLDEGVSLAEARDEFVDKVQKSKNKPVECPCCLRNATLYKRKLNSGMSRVLIRLYHLSVPSPDWVHIHTIFGSGSQKHRDWTLTKFWGLIVPKPPGRTPEDNSSGYWMITAKGIEFVRNKISVPRHVFVWDNKAVGFSDESTDIVRSLSDKFDYAELMAGD